VEEVPEPRVTKNTVKVKIMNCGVCRTDVHFAYDGPAKPAYFPQIIGHEASGEVVEKGEEVSNVQIGDRVVISCTQGCDHCDYCLAGRENLCRTPRSFGFQTEGGFAEYAVVPDNYVVKLSSSLPWESGVLACSGAAAHHAVYDIAKVNPNDHVLIVGAGGLGLFTVQLCKIVGAKVLVADMDDRKLQLAKELGADDVIKTGGVNYVGQVRDLMQGDGASVIIEFVSKSELIKNDIEILSKAGRLVFVGYDTNGFLNTNPLDLILKEATVFASKGATLRNLREVMDLAENKKVRLSVAATLPLSLVNEALMRLKNNEVVGRICVSPSA